VAIGQQLMAIGFDLVATGGTHELLAGAGVPARRVCKLAEGRPNIVDLITNGEVQLLINTPTRRGPTTDEGKIRAAATIHMIPLITTITAGRAAVAAITALLASSREDGGDPGLAWTVKPLQEYF
jgi:carbamoyl-phosphate synthase large subunit